VVNIIGFGFLIDFDISNTVYFGIDFLTVGFGTCFGVEFVVGFVIGFF
jgi:hypothetical protein